MYREHSVGVAIPAYNEEGFVGTTLDSVPSFVDRVYVVDDGSTDGTWAEITETAGRLNEEDEHDTECERESGEFRQTSGLRRFSRRVVPIQHEENRGVGGAIRTGYQRAREDGIDVTAVMGGDAQMEPEMLDGLLDPIVEGRADYTKGNRFLNRTGRENMPAFRFVGNTVLSGLTKIASGYWACGDPQSGYTAISLDALERVNIDELYEGYGYCNDLLVKLNVAGLRVVDVPRPITYGEEESHINYRSYIPRVSGMLLRNFLWRLRTRYLLFDFHPLVVAYAVGALATLAGVGMTLVRLVGPGGGGGAVGPASTGEGDSTGNPDGAADGAGGGSTTSDLGLPVLVGLVGVLSLVWAMVLDMEENAELNDVDRRSTVPATDRVVQDRPTNAENGHQTVVEVRAGRGTETGENGEDTVDDSVQTS